MSYLHSASLQRAVFQALLADETLVSLVGQNVFDAMPSGQLPDLFVSLGSETVRDASDKTSYATRHEFTISVISTHSGFLEAKTAAAAIGRVLSDPDLTLSHAQLTFLNFDRATARRDTDSQTRRIDLVFRARIDTIITE